MISVLVILMQVEGFCGLKLSRDLHTSFIIHEIAHALTIGHLQNKIGCVAAAEYIAYTTQFSLMPKKLRQKILARIANEGFTDEGEISLEHKNGLRTGKETQIVDEAVVLSENVDIYGSFRTFAETGAGDPTLNDGSSRLGIRLSRSLANGKTLFGRTEWKVNLVDSDSRLFSSHNASGGITKDAPYVAL